MLIKHLNKNCKIIVKNQRNTLNLFFTAPNRKFSYANLEVLQTNADKNSQLFQVLFKYYI
jgi:hypothetical protein